MSLLGHKPAYLSESSHIDCVEPPGGRQTNNDSEEENLSEDVLNLGQDLGMYNVEGQRIVQVEHTMLS